MPVVLLAFILLVLESHAMDSARESIQVEVSMPAVRESSALEKLDDGASYVAGGIPSWLRPVATIAPEELERGISNLCSTLMQALQKAAPDAWSVEFNLGFKAAGGVPVLLSGEGNAALKVTLSWKKPD